VIAAVFFSLFKKLGSASWTLPSGEISIAYPGKAQADAEAIAAMIHELEPFIPASALYRNGEMPVVLEVSSAVSHEMRTRFLHQNGTWVVLKISREALRYCCQHNTSSENLESRARFVWSFPLGNVGLLADTERNGALCGCCQQWTWHDFFHNSPEPCRFEPRVTGGDPFGCALLCDEERPELTHKKLVAYGQSGERIIQQMCKPCVNAALREAMAPFAAGTVDLQRPPCLSRFVAGTRVRIPLGQVMSSLCADYSFRELIRRWFEATYEHAVRHCHSLVQVCPNHPQSRLVLQSFSTGLYCAVPGCPMKLCPSCRTWHHFKNICDLSRHPQCPKCHILTERNGGCSHIQCPCGHHWCYQCGTGFQTAGACYAHMLSVHGSYGFA
jgi:hypothetical protein